MAITELICYSIFQVSVRHMRIGIKEESPYGKIYKYYWKNGIDVVLYV